MRGTATLAGCHVGMTPGSDAFLLFFLIWNLTQTVMLKDVGKQTFKHCKD